MNPDDYPLVGQHVYLRPVEMQDYDLIRRSELAGMVALEYRHYGATPSPEQFMSSLWGGVLAQYMVCGRADNAQMGMVNCYGADMKNGFAYVAALIFAPYRGKPVAHDGMRLFIDYLWRAFPFRKLYAEALEPNLAKFQSAVTLGWTEEARFTAHQYIDGRYVDKAILALTREAWAERVSRRRSGSGLRASVRRVEAGGEADLLDSPAAC